MSTCARRWCGWWSSCLLLTIVCVPPVLAENASNIVRRVAIAPLRLLDSQLDSKAMRQAFADLLAASLARHDGIQVVEREQLGKILDEKTLSLLNNGDAGLKISLAGADYVCTGTYERQTNRVIISVRLIDTVSSSVAGVFRSDGDWNDLDAITRQLAKDIATKILGTPSAPVSRTTDRSPRASARYLRGLALMGQGDYAAAATEFIAARSIDPNMCDATVPLGKAFMEIGLHADAVLEFSKYLKKYPNGQDTQEAKTLRTVCEAKLTPEQRDIVKQVLEMPKIANKGAK